MAAVCAPLVRLALAGGGDGRAIRTGGLRAVRKRFRGAQEAPETLTADQVTEIYSLSALGGRREGYRVTGPDQAPSFFPPTLLSKTHDIVYLASETASGTVVVVASLRRYDLPANTVDQQSFGVVYVPNSPSPVSSAMWLHHAGSRTPMPTPMKNALLSSQIPSKFPLPDDLPSSLGSLSDIPNTPQKGAFDSFVRRLA